MIEYYAGLVRRYGKLTAHYKNAICYVMDEEHIYEAMEPSMESERFILTDLPHSTVRKKGFPLEDKVEQGAVEDGFLLFFERVLKLRG